MTWTKSNFGSKYSIFREIDVKIRNFFFLLLRNTFDFGLWAAKKAFLLICEVKMKVPIDKSFH